METDTLTYYCNLKEKYPVLSKKAFDDYHKQLPNESIKELLIFSNTGLVLSKAFFYKRKGISVDDLIQEGFIGLKKGVEDYDPTAGCEPSTYLTWWIAQPMRRALREKKGIIRVPSHAYDHARAYQTFLLKFEEQHGRQPTTEELSAHAPEFLHHYRREKTHAMASIRDEEAQQCTNPESFVETFLAEEQRTFVQALLEKLPLRERFIIQASYWEGQSAATVAKLLPVPVSRTRVLELKEKGIKDLRRILERKHLTAADI
ncbi:MAG: sigma-70 family RNA polymerase sigma factor [Nanoarchaeota archaeon]|nr:sigma-70 family RNA polymerase sigma factor [Nanoarchaeota archaeon]